MSLRINIETDNAAFGDDPSPELARILRKLADHIGELDIVGDLDYSGQLLDVNGNTVGSWEFT